MTILFRPTAENFPYTVLHQLIIRKVFVNKTKIETSRMKKAFTFFKLSKPWKLPHEIQTDRKNWQFSILSNLWTDNVHWVLHGILAIQNETQNAVSCTWKVKNEVCKITEIENKWNRCKLQIYFILILLSFYISDSEFCRASKQT